MGRKKNSPVAMIAIFMVLILFILFFQMGWAASLSLDTGIGADLVAVMPGLFVTIIGLIMVGSQFNNPLVVGAFGAVGIGFAVLMQEMYDASILDATLLSGTLIGQLEVIIIIISLLLGGVAYATQG